jgi:integrase
MRITKRACEDLAKRDPNRPKEVHWDDDLVGFGLRHYAKGRISFILRYRVKGEPGQRFVTLGNWPAMLPDRAREEASRIRMEAGLGRDAIAERREEAEEARAARQAAEDRAIPISRLLDTWRAATEAQVAKKEALGESVVYERELLRIEAKTLRPAIGAQTVGAFAPERLQALIDTQPSVNTARNLRNLVARVAKAVNTQLVLAGIPIRWPTAFTVTGKPRSRDHRFSIEQAAGLWLAAGALGRRGALVRFLMLTGCRRVEAQKVEWAHLVLEDPVKGAYWQQPSRLVKNRVPHQVPLSAPAVALLRWLPPRDSRRFGEAELVFAGRAGKPVSSFTDIRRELLRRSGVEAGTLHDIRRTIVSALGDHGFDPQVADTLLNHVAASTMKGVMAVYQRSDLWVKKREAIDTWAGLLMAAVAKLQDKPPGPKAWGFDTPFSDARIKRPAQVARAASSPGADPRSGPARNGSPRRARPATPPDRAAASRPRGPADPRG